MVINCLNFCIFVLFLSGTVIISACPRAGSIYFDKYDFISRVFHGGEEDAVCGSAHCTLGDDIQRLVFFYKISYLIHHIIPLFICSGVLDF